MLAINYDQSEWRWIDSCILWVLIRRSLDHAAGPRPEWSPAVERGQRIVNRVGVWLVIGIQSVGVNCLPQGVVIVHNAVAAGQDVSNITILFTRDLYAYNGLSQQLVSPKSNTSVANPDM